MKTPPFLLAAIRRSLLIPVGLAALAAGPLARGQQPPAVPARSAPPKVVLKLDDMINAAPQWQQVLASVQKRGIKASFGIICNSLENPKPGYLEFIKQAQATGRIEFWCHGYDHKMWAENGLSLAEFYGVPLAQQKEHLAKCQKLAREKLGAPFASFGAPGNQTDEKGAEALRDDPDFKVWMYGDAQFPVGKTVLVRYGDVNIENPIFHPSTERLAAGMAKHAAAPYFVIQGHPPQWDAARMAEFEKMLDYLTEQKAVFMTPSELAATLPAPGPAGALPPPSKPIKAPATPAPAAAALPPGKPVGQNLITNGDFSADLESWKLDRVNNTPADIKVEDIGGGKHAAHITVPQVGEKRFYVQLTPKEHFRINDGKTYTLAFRAKASPEASTVVVISTAQGQWEALARQDNIKLSTDWKDYSFTVQPAHGFDNAGMTISGLAATAAEYWFTDVSLKENQ